MTARERLRRTAGFLRFAARRGRDDGVSRMAGSLAFTSLLSLVPLFAIALAMLAAFPAFDSVRQDLVAWAFRTFAPSIGEVVQLQIHRFIGNAGRLSAIGILSLVITAIMLLVTIEGTMNAIFRVAKARSALSKLLVYWTALTLGPLLMGAALSLQGYVTALSRWSVTKAVTPFLALPLPSLLTALAFAVLFAAIPNRRVSIRDALIGAAAAALLFAALRWGFGLYITSSRTYASLYGAVAVLPVFLMWTWLSWLAILAGAEITAALPEWRSGQRLGGAGTRPARRLTLALEVLALLRDLARQGGTGASRRDLLARTSADERELLRLLVRLHAAGFTAPTIRRRVVLARDLETVTLADLVAALDLELELEPSSRDAPWRARAAALVDQARQGGRAAMAVSLRALLASDQ